MHKNLSKKSGTSFHSAELFLWTLGLSPFLLSASPQTRAHLIRRANSRHLGIVGPIVGHQIGQQLHVAFAVLVELGHGQLVHVVKQQRAALRGERERRMEVREGKGGGRRGEVEGKDRWKERERERKRKREGERERARGRWWLDASQTKQGRQTTGIEETLCYLCGQRQVRLRKAGCLASVAERGARAVLHLKVQMRAANRRRLQRHRHRDAFVQRGRVGVIVHGRAIIGG